MAVNSSLQQISGGVASVLAGVIMAEGSDGRLEHFDRLGLILITAVLGTVGMMHRIHLQVQEGASV